MEINSSIRLHFSFQINGQRGYIPSTMLREKKVYHSKLIHDVPTETIFARGSNNDSRNKKTSEENNVPKLPAILAAAPDTVGDDAEEAANGIAKDESGRSVPVLDQVSPSYEIHDGTTLPYARNDEPSEPSYATQVHRGMADVGEQPILSIHPNIASTVTLKASAGHVSVDEPANDAAKYLEATSGLREPSPGRKMNEEGVAATSTESPSEPPATSVDGSSTEESEEALNDSSIELEDGVEGVVKATTKSDVSDDRDNAEDTTESVDDEEGAPDQEADTPARAASFESRSAVEKTAAVSEQLPKIDTEAALDETVNEQAAIDSLKNNTESEENIADANSSLEVGESGKNMSEEASVHDNLGAAVEANTTKDARTVEDNSSIGLAPNEEPTEANSTSAMQESSPEVDASLVAQSEDTKSEESVETETEDALPGNLKIMNPLFNRLSKLPVMVKKVVDDAMSGGASGETPTSAEEVADPAEPERTSSGEEDIFDTKESGGLPGDFTTDIDDRNVYENDTDSADQAVVAPEVETATKPEVRSVDPDKFVNIYSDSSDNETSSNVSTADSLSTQASQEFTTESPVQPDISKEDEFTGFRQDNSAIDDTSSFNGFPANRNLLNVGSTLQNENIADSRVETATPFDTPVAIVDQSAVSKAEETPEVSDKEAAAETADRELFTDDVQSTTEHSGTVDEVTRNDGDEENHGFLHEVRNLLQLRINR